VTFKILGTAAAEGWPALFCPCPLCEEARRRRGRDIRRRAAYQLGDRIHVDLGPDTYAQMLEFGLRYDRLEHLLITHSHFDHLCAQEIAFRRPGFAVALPDDAMMTIYGNVHVQQCILAAGVELEACKAQFRLIKPFDLIELGEAVTATPILADHGGEEEAVNYVFEREARALLQGNDTGFWPEESWEFLSEKSLNVAIIECTYGPKPGGRHHLGAYEVLQVRDRLAKLGVLAADCRVVTTHFSHNGGWLHDQLCEFFEPEGIEVAYDGIELEL
jgi:phosphoribosyl 1,2-cyclic phosphate phosphodiesterase